MVEQLGSGMGRILNAYDRNIFKFTSDFLIVTFPFADGFDVAIDANHDANGVKNGVNVILNAFRENPNITIKGLAKATGISARTIDREVESLKAEGRLKRIGSTRSGHWEVYEV